MGLELAVLDQLTVENGGKAGAMGQALRVDNVTVSFKTVTPAPDGLLIHFESMGAPSFGFSVNGSVINADNFQDLDGQTAGWNNPIRAGGGNGNDTGILVFQGKPIQEAAIGGQELWIDRICLLTGDPNEGGTYGRLLLSLKS